MMEEDDDGGDGNDDDDDEDDDVFGVCIRTVSRGEDVVKILTCVKREVTGRQVVSTQTSPRHASEHVCDVLG